MGAIERCEAVVVAIGLVGEILLFGVRGIAVFLKQQVVVVGTTPVVVTIPVVVFLSTHPYLVVGYNLQLKQHVAFAGSCGFFIIKGTDRIDKGNLQRISVAVVNIERIPEVDAQVVLIGCMLSCILSIAFVKSCEAKDSSHGITAFLAIDTVGNFVGKVGVIGFGEIDIRIVVVELNAVLHTDNFFRTTHSAAHRNPKL